MAVINPPTGKKTGETHLCVLDFISILFLAFFIERNKAYLSNIEKTLFRPATFGFQKRIINGVVYLKNTLTFVV